MNITDIGQQLINRRTLGFFQLKSISITIRKTILAFIEYLYTTVINFFFFFCVFKPIVLWALHGVVVVVRTLFVNICCRETATHKVKISLRITGTCTRTVVFNVCLLFFVDVRKISGANRRP